MGSYDETIITDRHAVPEFVLAGRIAGRELLDLRPSATGICD